MFKEAWTLSIETLSWMEMRRLSEPLALARTVKQLGITDYNVVRMAHQLVTETVRRQNFIDWFITDVVGLEEFESFSLGVQAFLRLFVYQTRVAKNWSALDFDEAESVVRLARSILGWKTMQPVEPVLGALLIHKQTSVLDGLNDEERIGLETFHPSWFVKYCTRLFGRVEAIRFLQANMAPSPTYLRINTVKAREDEVLKRLAEEGVCLEKVEGLRLTYEVKSAQHPVAMSDSFRNGLFFVQDKASCFAVQAGNPARGATVLDICAAPGAKTTYLAELMSNEGEIISIDYSKRRMNTWKNEVAKSGVDVAEPLVADARVCLPLNAEADLVFLDPPCTGTGTFGKTASAKWRLTLNSVEKMADIQWVMLNKCSSYVKPGGALTYSTCSITVEENEMLIERFLKWHTEFSLVEIEPSIGSPGLRGLEKCQRLYPHVHRCNGFFIAKVARMGSTEDS